MKHQYNETDCLLELVRKKLPARVGNFFCRDFDDHNVISIVEKDLSFFKGIPNFGDKSLKSFITFLITFDGFTDSAKKLIHEKFGDDIGVYRIDAVHDFTPATRKKINNLRQVLKSEGYAMQIRRIKT